MNLRKANVLFYFCNTFLHWKRVELRFTVLKVFGLKIVQKAHLNFSLDKLATPYMHSLTISHSLQLSHIWSKDRLQKLDEKT